MASMRSRAVFPRSDQKFFDLGIRVARVEEDVGDETVCCRIQLFGDMAGLHCRVLDFRQHEFGFALPEPTFRFLSEEVRQLDRLGDHGVDGRLLL